jgi:hypothetical protein
MRTPGLLEARLAALAALGVALVACSPVDRVARAACDQVDHDGSGSVDNVDADGDGLCDCLRLGVYGYPGSTGDIEQLKAWMHAKLVPTVLIGNRPLTPEILAGFDVLLVQDVRDGADAGNTGREGIGVGIGRAFSDAEVQALVAWVNAGGGLMTLSGFGTTSAENTNVNRLLGPFGLSYGEEHILNGSGAPVVPVVVTHWDASHPIANGMARATVYSAYAVSGGTLVAWEPTAGAYDLGRATQSGLGRVFAWGDEWIEYDSEWSRADLDVRRLWQNAFWWLTPPGYCQIPLPGG